MEKMFNKNITATEIAELYSFLAAILNNSPDEMSVKNLRTYFLDNDDELMGDMKEFWKQRAEMNDADIAQELAVEWTRLFRGLSPQLGPPPPYAGIYSSKDGTGIETISAIQNAYKSTDLAIGTQHRNRADYLGFELEFIAHMATQVAIAQKNNDLEKANLYSRKLDNFTRTFISPWISEFVDKALIHVNTSFFKGYLELLKESVEILND